MGLSIKHLRVSELSCASINETSAAFHFGVLDRASDYCAVSSSDGCAILCVCCRELLEAIKLFKKSPDCTKADRVVCNALTKMVKEERTHTKSTGPKGYVADVIYLHIY